MGAFLGLCFLLSLFASGRHECGVCNSGGTGEWMITVSASVFFCSREENGVLCVCCGNR